MRAPSLALEVGPRRGITLFRLPQSRPWFAALDISGERTRGRVMRDR
ncbi:MAG: hypothetical protein MUC56_01260 [Thermoanaerobaculales bacterium]|nr:hypothetical protein [Thermoanaerobaculales bacterium]